MGIKKVGFYEKYWKKITAVSLVWAVLSLIKPLPQNKTAGYILGYLTGRFVGSFILFFLFSSLVGYVYLFVKNWYERK